MAEPTRERTDVAAIASVPERACDLSVTCFVCGSEMRPEHAHYRCPACGWRDSCCDGPY